ncbi:MAG: MATE family efflux transporter [Clostridiaceae bacterium]|jgi:putative MATE family efflux protein|nr:MATE family efflux transporter [Clostridiaceae bacterium]
MKKLLFGDSVFYKNLFRIAIPITIQNLIMSSLNFVDTIMVGQLGETNIAAVALANQLFFLIALFLFGVGSGASVFVAQFWGKKDVINIRKVLGLSMLCSVVVSVLATLIVMIFPEVVLSLFTKDTEVIRISASYLRIVCFSYIPTSITFCFASTLRSTGQSKLPMIASAVALSVNTVLNYIFIFGKLGMPAMGARGAAAATVIARFAEAILILGAVYSLKLAPAASFRELFAFSRDFAVRFFQVVIPVIMNEVLWSTGVTMYTVVYGRMGTNILASINIASAIEGISFVLFRSMSNACAVLVGNKIGEGDEQTAFTYSLRMAILGPALGITVGLILFFSSGNLLVFYNVTEQVYENARIILRIFSFVIPLKVFNMINIVGILRSGGDTKFSLILDTFGVWFIAVPLAFVGGLVYHLPVYIVYVLVNLEEIFKFSLGLKRFISKKWINNVIVQME